MKILGLIFFLVMGIALSMANAQKRHQSHHSTPPDRHVERNQPLNDQPARKQTIIFDDHEEVRAGRDSGAGDWVQVTLVTRKNSLIQMREHFFSELIKSAEDL